jgi:hypothetical protein
MPLTDYDRRGMWRLPSQVFKAIERAVTLHRPGRVPSRSALQAHADAVRLLNDFAGVHITYRDSVYRAMVQAGVDGPDAEPELACEVLSEGALDSLVRANDKCHAEAYAIGTARRLLAKLEGA